MTNLRRKFIEIMGKEKWQVITIPAFAILLSLIAGAIIILILGRNPLSAFYNLLQGAGIMPKANYAAYKNNFTDFMSLLDAMTPLLFASLAVAVGLRAGLFNIGVSGQMLLAGFMSTVLIGYSGLPAVLAKPLVILVGMAAGGLLGALIGFLKYRFNINEVVSSLMFNYIAQYVISFFIQTRYIDPVSRQSRYISDAARLTFTNVEIGGLRMDISMGIFIAILVSILLKFFMDKTRIGFELSAVGSNPRASRYAGMNVGRSMILAMVLSGALAGLAGVTYYLGYYASIQPRVLSATGFDGIAVALLGNSNPIGIIFASLLISIIENGSTYMSSISGIRQEIASVITGLILLFSATGTYIKYRIKTTRDKMVYDEKRRLDDDGHNNN